MSTIQEAHHELGRLVGGGAALAFAVALLASGASSSSVGTYAGQVVMAGFINIRIPLLVRRAVTMVPALIVLAVGVSPTSALVLSQVVLSFGIPFALVPLVVLTSRRDVMGVHVNRRLTTRRACAVAARDHRDERVPDLPAGLLLSMALADTFNEIVESLPDDWTDLELDLRIFDERRYVDAAVLLVTCNAQPYSKNDWHWRLLVAHRFGHAAAAPAVHTALKLLDEAGIDGELAVREVRTGRVEVVPRCGAAPSRSARSSSSSAPSSAWRASVAFIPTCCSDRTSSARSARPGMRCELVLDLGRRGGRPTLLIVDLTARRRARGSPRSPDRSSGGGPVLAFYSHVEADVARPAAGRPASTSSSRARGWRARAPRWSTGSLSR